MGYTSIKIKDEDKRELDRLNKETGFAKHTLISFSLKFVPWDVPCKRCGKAFIDHAFIFDHEFDGGEK